MSDADNIRLEVAKRLRVAREQAGLSQGQVAKMLGYQRPTVSEIEAGRRKVGAEELVKFSELYNVSVSWITDQNPELANPAIELAARELSKLKGKDFDAVLEFLNKMRRPGNDKQNN